MHEECERPKRLQATELSKFPDNKLASWVNARPGCLRKVSKILFNADIMADMSEEVAVEK